MTAERVDAKGVIDRLAAARVAGPSGLAFDADGTLWSGDVGEDVFQWTCERELLREESLEALTRAARAHALSAEGSPSQIARSLYAGYLAGRVLEVTMCEIMTWCYAGFSLEELCETARQAFAERRLEGRRHDVLAPILEWAARERLHVVVVSASPFPIVHEALGVAGIRVASLAAARAETIYGRVAPSMAGPVPYAAEKLVSGKRVLEGRDWLGSFGDNAFDVEMLRAARVGVAVCPKPVLVARLHELSNTVVLE